MTNGDISYISILFFLGMFIFGMVPFFDTVDAQVQPMVRVVPPELHSIMGFVHHNDNITQVPVGTNVTLNATLTGSFVETQTNGPPGFTGFFGTTINATDGELVIVKAFNETYIGESRVFMLPNPSVTKVNVTLNNPFP